MQCNSIDNNLDLCSAVECTAAHLRLTKSPEEEEKSLYVFFCISAYISIGREIRCLPYAGFLSIELHCTSFYAVYFTDKF